MCRSRFRLGKDLKDSRPKELILIFKFSLGVSVA